MIATRERGVQRGRGGVAELKAGRLRLVTITPAMLEAELDGDYARLGQLLGARVTVTRVTREWPPVDWEPHVFRIMLKQFDEWPETLGWHRYVVLQGWLGRRTLVGAVGGFPRPQGEVEIGYSTLPEYQRRGFATAFAGALVEWLLGREGVRCVSAQAMEGVAESIKVMERCGMRFVGQGDDEGTVRYRVGEG